MIWIPVLAVPAALALMKLGAAVAMVSVLKTAVQVALVLLVLALCALAWTLLGRGRVRAS
jgi:hypothetical protein